MSRYLVPTSKDLGELVRGFRKQRGWTQARLAEQAGLLSKTVSAIETGGGQVLLANVMRCLSALDADLFLGARSETGALPVPEPQDARRPQATVVVRTPPPTVEPRRSPVSATATTDQSALVTTRPAAKKAGKSFRSGPARRAASVAKALKEKW